MSVNPDSACRLLTLSDVELFPGEQCRARFDLCLAMEFEHPSTYGAVHHLTVACYLLQHNEYSREGWLATRKMIAQVIRQGINPSELIRRNRRIMDSGRRQWRVTKGEKIAAVEDVFWTRTIADVRLDNSEVYCADVRLWAVSVIEDTEPLMQKLLDAP